MPIIIGSARQDERGHITGGQAGDQNGKEVSTQPMYLHSKGWYVIRPKKVVHANKIAERMQTACDNPCLGYDQNQRLGVIQNGIDTRMLTECDCSSLVRACVKEATGIDPGNFNTSTEVVTLQRTGLFEKEFTYINQSSTPVYDGDILVTRIKGHTVIVVSGSPREAVEVSEISNKGNIYPKYKGASNSIVDALKSIGENNTSLASRKMIAKANGIDDYRGTPEQNIRLLILLKEGKLIRA